MLQKNTHPTPTLLDQELDKIILEGIERAKETIMDPSFTTLLRGENGIINAAGQRAICADTLAEKVFLRTLIEHGVNGVLYSEESGVIPIGNPDAEDAVSILIDPLDGSKNFKKGRPFGCISVAYGKRTEAPKLSDLTHAVILNLYADELYCAVRGKGAWYNGRPIEKKEEGISHLRYYSYAEEVKKFFRNYEGAQTTKSLGSVAWELALVANNLKDVFVDVRGKIKPHDFAAAKIIIEEAGGLFDSFDDYSPDDIPLGDFQKGYMVIASRDPQVFRSLEEQLKDILL